MSWQYQLGNLIVVFCLGILVGVIAAQIDPDAIVYRMAQKEAIEYRRILVVYNPEQTNWGSGRDDKHSLIRKFSSKGDYDQAIAEVREILGFWTIKE